MNRDDLLHQYRLTRREALRLALFAGAGLGATNILAACGAAPAAPPATAQPAAKAPAAVVPTSEVKGAQQQGVITMKLGSDSPAGHPYNIGLEAFGREVQANTNGRITFTIFPDAQLGGEEDMTNGLRLGAVDAIFTSSGVLAPSAPEVGIFDMPFLFRDVNHMISAANGPIGDRLKSKIEPAVGAELLGWGTTGTRHMWNNKRPIRTPEDVRGLKMRTQTSKIQQDTYTALGGLPTPIPFVETYTALQTGVVDGSDIAVPDMVPFKLYQVSKYMTLTAHYFIACPFLVSSGFLGQLSPEDQNIVRAAARTGSDAFLKATLDQEASGMDELRNQGMEIIEMQDRNAFVQAVEPVYTQNAALVGGADLIQQIRNSS